MICTEGASNDVIFNIYNPPAHTPTCFLPVAVVANIEYNDSYFFSLRENMELSARGEGIVVFFSCIFPEKFAHDG